MTAVVWLLAVVVAVLALLVVGLLRSHATILRALHDAGIDVDPDGGASGPVRVDDPQIRTVPGVPGPADASGRRALDIMGRTPEGGTKTVAVTNGATTLLAFLTAGCTTCAGFWDAFGSDELDLPGGVRVVIVTKGPELESPADVAALAPNAHATIQSTQAWDDYRIPVAPYFVLVDGRRGVVVGEGAAASWDRVRDLLRRAMADADLGHGKLDRRELFQGRRAERAERDR